MRMYLVVEAALVVAICILSYSCVIKITDYKAALYTNQRK